MEDGSIVGDDDNDSNTPKRVKANFGDLFSGMPSMNDILTGSSSITETVDGNDNEANTSTNNPQPQSTSSPPQQDDDAWFDEERMEIQSNYDTILRQMMAQLEQQRQQDPASVPSNAAAMIQDVLQQEMKTEIDVTREDRAREKLDAYSEAQKEAVEAQNVEGVTNQVVDNLMKEDKDAQAVADAAQARIDDYRRYELEAFLKKPNQESGADLFPLAPAETESLDQWALDRLQEMVDNRLEGDNEEDDNILVTDILEDSLEELQERMEQEAGRTSIKPQNMKEWQMYHAISSRLGNAAAEKAAAELAAGGSDTDTSVLSSSSSTEQRNIVPEEQIAAQLESWKTYIAKEGVIREKSGLSRGLRLPFEWQESGRDLEVKEAQIKAAMAASQGGSANQAVKTRVEIRKNVNRRSLQAMERLVLTSDPIRSARLQKDLDILREELEANDYLDIDEAALEEQETFLSGPVDMKGVFKSSDDEATPTSSVSANSGGDGIDQLAPPNTPFFDQPIDTEKTGPNPTSFSDNENTMKSKSAPPATPFFSDGVDDDDDDDTATPDTPFFSSPEDKPDEVSAGSGYSLGTIDEQKLRLMYQRAGARTDEEKAVIRAQWEDFQKFEQSKRDGSGLTDGDDSALLDRAKLKYDVAEVTKADGDFDAEKILATIGPRPTRKRKPEGALPPTDKSPKESNLGSAEVSDSLYRAVSAVGGGRTKDDPEAKAKEKAAFNDFIEKEDEMRLSLDSLDEEIAAEVSSEATEDFDDTKYADEVLASLGSRPQPKRRKISETKDSDRETALPDIEDDDDDGDDNEDDDEDTQSTKKAPIDKLASEDELLPDWIRKDRESARSKDGTAGGRGGFLGSDIDEVFDDDVYEHNQRQLAEYERRRAGGKKQVGIDISDVLGRSSEDYADYTYDDNYLRGATQHGWGSDGFESRKKNLLEYIELNVMEINALMDHKDSVHSTGVSQYLPRINKPFKEFGAIFRLEGVLLDTTGFQYKAWSKVALEKGFKPPSVEDVRRASVLRPDIAIRDALFWTDDIIRCREIASTHEAALQEVFDEWIKESSIEPITTVEPVKEIERASLGIGEDVASRQPAVAPLAGVSEGERLNIYHDAWSRTAVTHRQKGPSREQVEMASVLSPEIAVRKAFQWSEDEAEIDKYAKTYRGFLRDLSGGSDKTEEVEETIEIAETPESPKVLDETTMMELHFKAWTKLAEENGFELPLPEEVLAAVVINDPAVAIRDGFGWCDDSSRIPSLVVSFGDSLEESLSNWRGKSKAAALSAPEPEKEPPQQPAVEKNNMPTQEEMLEMQDHAWASAALNHGFQKPLVEWLELAMKMTPQEAITRLFSWTSDEKVIAAVCVSFESALNDISQKYIRKYNIPHDTPLFPRQQVTVSPPKQASSGTEDVFQLAMDAWTAVAENYGFDLPDQDQVLFALSVGAEDAIISGFEWAGEPQDVKRIIAAYRDELADWRSKQPAQETSQPTLEETSNSLPMYTIVPGAEHWLESLLEVEMQCAMVSYLSREQVDVLLKVSGLAHLLGPDKRVSSSNKYGRDVDQLLGASLRAERRPDHCVLFDSSPHSSEAAHRVEMQSVGVIGAFPRYDLLTADSTAGSFDELTAMNIRRLFAERVYDQPMVDLQPADPEKVRRTKTKFFWKGDD